MYIYQSLFFLPDYLYSRENKEFSFFSRLEGLSNSDTSPLFNTKIRSEYRTVLILCAIVSTVLSANCFLITFWIKVSVSRSMLAVASSIRTILFGFNRERAMFISCFYPELKLSPPSVTNVLSPYAF